MTRLVEVLQFIRPGAEFYVSDDQLTWTDETQSQPTEAEIETGFAEYDAWKAEQDDAKAQTKAALLDRLGITAEEAQLLLS
jgi:hypothetical protein